MATPDYFSPTGPNGGEQCTADKREIGDLDLLEIIAQSPPNASFARHLNACSVCRSRQTELRNLLATVIQARQDQGDSNSEAETPPEVGPYQVVRKLGEGGHGQVFRARDASLKRDVAVKVPRIFGRIDRPEMLAQLYVMFISEGQKAAKIEHDNVLTVYAAGFCTHTGLVYIASQFIEAEKDRTDLGQHMSGWSNDANRLSANDSIGIVLQAASGVAKIQTRMLHRDLKPDNLLLQPKGNRYLVKVTDFSSAGVGRRSDGSYGTREYRAPEADAGSEHMDKRSDVYSLGAILYELLAGERWNRRSTPVHLPDKVRTDLRWPNVLEWIMNKCLAEDPSHRFDDARQLERALRDYRKNCVPKGCALPTRQRVKMFTARNRIPVVIAVAAIITTIAGASFHFAFRADAKETIDNKNRKIAGLEREVGSKDSMLSGMEDEQKKLQKLFQERNALAIQSMIQSSSRNLNQINLSQLSGDSGLPERMRVFERDIQALKESLANSDTPIDQATVLICEALLKLAEKKPKEALHFLRPESFPLTSASDPLETRVLAWAQNTRNLAYLQDERTDEAIAGYQAQAKLSPENWMPHAARGYFLGQCDNAPGALKELSEARRLLLAKTTDLDPNSRSEVDQFLTFLEGKYLLSLDRQDEAIKTLKHAHAIELPNSLRQTCIRALIAIDLARAYGMTRQIAAAIKLQDGVIRQMRDLIAKGNRLPASPILGLALFNRGESAIFEQVKDDEKLKEEEKVQRRFSRAVEYYSEALPLLEKNGCINTAGQVYYRRGAIRRNIGANLNECLADLNRGIDILRKENERKLLWNALVARALVKYAHNDHHNALADLDEAIGIVTELKKSQPKLGTILKTLEHARSEWIAGKKA